MCAIHTSIKSTILNLIPFIMTNQKREYVVPMIIISALFFIFGFVTWVNGTLIPYLKIACELESDLQSYLVATAFFIAFLVMGFPSSIVLKKIGYKKGMSLGLFIMAIGAILFIPAAQSRNFNLFLFGLFIIGTGLALLQTAVNPYASIIGPPESAASRISIVGFFNKVAGILATLIFGYIALDDYDAIVGSLKAMDPITKEITLNELSGRVVVPYIIIASVLIIMSIGVLFSSLPDLKDDGNEKDTPQIQSNKTSILQHPHLLLGVLAIFLYVGVEVIAGDTIISYGKSLGIEMAIAKFFTLGTLAFMSVGYIIGVLTIPKYISQAAALKICAVLGIAFTCAAILTNGYVSVAFIFLLGLANSLMWPAIFPMAINGLGKFTKTGSGLLISAISGGAILPLVYGWLAGQWNTQLAYCILVPCYIYILYYSLRGHLVGRTRTV